jgi:hypothetical protein
MKHYYQPQFNNDNSYPIDVDGNELICSYAVFKSENICKRAFPNNEVLKYSDDDIEEPVFIDHLYKH